MEVAIPAILLGSIYLINDRKNNNLEGFKNEDNNTDKSKERNLLRTQNLKKLKKNEEDTFLQDNYAYQTDSEALQEYLIQADYKDKFNQPQEITNVRKGESTLLSGEKFDKTKFTHNNMKPFFGSKVTEGNARKENEQVLDRLQGSGSLYMRKQEQAPLFAPKENMQWAHGTPNHSDFMQSRVNEGMYRSNEKPFETEMVGPGLGKGYTTEGSGGFNSGMAVRDKWEPKTVDELRVLTNPKLTFGGRVLEGGTSVQNLGTIGKTEKYRPDTFYESGPERLFTTTGLEKGQTLRAIEDLKYENRADTTRDYYGGGIKEQKASYHKGLYEEPKREELDPDIKHISNSHIKTGHGNYGHDSYKPVTTNRSYNPQSTNLGGVSNLLNAAVAPLLDVFRPTRKENVVHNTYGPGGAMNTQGGSVPVEGKNKARTTIRETTSLQDNFGQVNASSTFVSGTSVNPQQSYGQKHESFGYIGQGGSSFTSKPTDNYAEFNARLNADKEQISFIGNYEKYGNVSLRNGNINQSNNNINKRDVSRINRQTMAPTTNYNMVPDRSIIGQNSVANKREYNNMERYDNSHISLINQNPYASAQRLN